MIYKSKKLIIIVKKNSSCQNMFYFTKDKQCSNYVAQFKIQKHYEHLSACDQNIFLFHQILLYQLYFNKKSFHKILVLYDLKPVITSTFTELKSFNFTIFKISLSGQS